MTSGWYTRRHNGSKWNRRYFVCHGTELFFYKSKKAFERMPTGFDSVSSCDDVSPLIPFLSLHFSAAPIRSRPIDISSYHMESVSVEPPYQFTLVPSGARENH